jgi:hypothetical protein
LGKGKDPALGVDTTDWRFWESMQCRLLSTFETPNTNGKIPFEQPPKPPSGDLKGV